MTRPARLVLAAIAALALAPAAGAKALSGDAFYTPPSPLPGKALGDPIWFRNAGASADTSLPGAARNLLVLYRSNGVAGSPVADSGAIALPKGKPPKGGWRRC